MLPVHVCYHEHEFKLYYRAISKRPLSLPAMKINKRRIVEVSVCILSVLKSKRELWAVSFIWQLKKTFWFISYKLYGMIFLRDILHQVLPTLGRIAVTFIPFSNFFIRGFQLVIPCYFFPFLDITLENGSLTE